MALNVPVPIYLNKDIIYDLCSVMLDGYSESKALKCSRNNEKALKLSGEASSKSSNDNRKTCSSKDCSRVKDRSCTLANDIEGTFQNENESKYELNFKKQYTLFYLFINLRKSMKNNNLIKNISKEDIINGRIKDGEYVELEGTICADTPLNRVNNLIDIIESYDSRELDKLMKDSEMADSITNYSVILKILIKLSNYLSKNNTLSLMVNLHGCSVYMNVNVNYFSDRNAFIYDNVDSFSRVLCKVVKTISKDQEINLFSKTGMDEYYKNFILSLNPYLELLQRNKIIMPHFEIQVNGPAVSVIPIAMFC